MGGATAGGGEFSKLMWATVAPVPPLAVSAFEHSVNSGWRHRCARVLELPTMLAIMYNSSKTGHNSLYIYGQFLFSETIPKDN